MSEVPLYPPPGPRSVASGGANFRRLKRMTVRRQRMTMRRHKLITDALCKGSTSSDGMTAALAQIEGYLAHENPPPLLGPYRRPMPRVLGGS